MSDDQEGTEASGVVTDHYRSSSENKPHGVHVDGTRYTTFNDKDVEGIEEGVTIQFRYVENGDHRNIVNDSVEIIEQDEEPKVYGSTDHDVVESPRDRSIRNNVALKQARELCQPLIHEDISESRFDEVVDLVEETAETFAEKLHELNRQVAESEQ